jgi:hypothetical protein
MHDRVLTAHNLIKRNWPCDYYCPLCMCSHEITLHLLTKWSYIEATWSLVAAKFGLPHFNVMSLRGDLASWMEYLLRTGSKKEQRKMVGILFIFWWNIWKERNNQIFRNASRSPTMLFNIIREDIHNHHSVFLVA